MPKDNEVDEKVMPVAWIVTNGGESCEPWLEYEQSEVDALPAVCIAEPLYSAATVAELRAEVERWKSRYDDAMQARADEQKRADAAERRVRELRHALVEVTASLAWLAHGECRNIHDGPIMPSDKAVQFSRATLTGADPT